MKIWIVYVYDRHVDPIVEAWADPLREQVTLWYSLKGLD